MFPNWKIGDFHDLNNKRVSEKPAGSPPMTNIQPHAINHTKPLTCTNGDPKRPDMSSTHSYGRIISHHQHPHQHSHMELMNYLTHPHLSYPELL